MLSLFKGKKEVLENTSKVEQEEDTIRVNCDINYNYIIDEYQREHRAIFTGVNRPQEILNVCVLYCNLSIKYKIEDDPIIHTINKKVERFFSPNLQDVYLKVKADLETDNMTKFLKRKVEEMIKKEILNQDAKDAKKFIQNNKDLKISFTLDIKK